MQNKEYKSFAICAAAFCFLTLFLGACNPTVYLAEDEALLTENKIKFEDRKASESRSLLRDQLALNYKQRPNKEFLFIPREWYYYRFENSSDSIFLISWIKKNVAEYPTVHDSSQVQETALAMQKFLRKDKGYYHAEVEHRTKIKDKEAFVTYLVETGRQFEVRTIEYITEDSSLVEVIDSLSEMTLISPGTGVTRQNFNREEARLVTALQNMGYAQFNSSFVTFQGDTSDFGFDVRVNVLAPAPGISHPKFTIGEIRVYTDYVPGQDSTFALEKQLDDVDFYSQSDEFFVTPRTLRKRVFIEEGTLYSRNKELRTAQNLTSLNTYRFVSLNPTVDEQLDSIINYNFQLYPIQNKWVSEQIGSVYLANVQRTDNRYFLGLSLSTNLSSRNLLQNAENFSVGLDGFVEFNLRSLNAIGATFQTGLSQPRLYDVMKLLTFAEKINLLPQRVFTSLNDHTNTDLGFSYSYSFTSTIYSLASLNANFGYDYRPSIQSSTLFNQIGINYLLLNPLETFQDILDDNPYLANAFNKRLLTGILFKDISWVYTKPPTSDGFSWGLTYFGEVSGLELSAINAGYNLLNGSNQEWNLPIGTTDSIEFSKFIKIDLDHHFNQKIIGAHSFAGRIRAGIALPFGGSEAVPFVRQFAVGGQNSIRGWQIRNLGPGGYDISKDPNAKPNTLPYQTGDFILESSLEYRFPVSGFLNGALFVDAGNVWTLSDADERTDSQLSMDFYKQIAIASGIGVRMDFSYFLLRFDFGYKIRNPFPNERGSYWNYSSFGWGNINDANLSFGVNLPF
ncbi:translocation and assembly module lipoprotein TamL [Portibacter marinus]|uniref:translocation and assembly module lipoprotein TamL n=1 Tax=Portibacter marinus TaxID=2898660 RepID=UPI001F28DFEB|nr:BamA/TamA family outer membrane protein [Portibacter marinus]